MGSAELNAVGPNNGDFNLSSEFAAPSSAFTANPQPVAQPRPRQDCLSRLGFSSPEQQKNKAKAKNKKGKSKVKNKTKAAASSAAAPAGDCVDARHAAEWEGYESIAGGLVLVKLMRFGDASTVCVTASWRTLDGKTHRLSEHVPVYNLTSGSPGIAPATLGLRKAVALSRYVDIQSEYCLDDGAPNANDASEAMPRLLATEVYHQKWVRRLCAFRDWFAVELVSVGDNSLATCNAATRDTLAQILSFEEADLVKTRKRIADIKKLSTPRRRSTRNRKLPDHCICPITLSVMTNPVIATDGHSYEKSAIERWFKDSDISPKTGAVLASKALVPNHGLRHAIHSLRSAPPSPPKATRASDATAAVPRKRGRNKAQTQRRSLAKASRTTSKASGGTTRRTRSMSTRKKRRVSRS